MADIDPYAQVQRYSPWNVTLIDAIAEAKRVTTAIMQANPLRNAVVDDGLMRWRGKYGDDFLWVGEIQPVDPTDGLPQRGFVVRRDDPGGHEALAVYDFAPKVGDPLRQKVLQRDADSRLMFQEGSDGGVYWPYSAMSVFADNVFEHEGAPRIKPLSIGTFAWRNLWKMSGSLTGPIVRCMPIIVSGGSPPIQYDVRLRAWVWTGSNWETAVSDIEPGSGVTHYNFTWDLTTTALWVTNAISYIQLIPEFRFTVIPAWVVASDTVWGYCNAAFVRGRSSVAETPLPPP